MTPNRVTHITHGLTEGGDWRYIERHDWGRDLALWAGRRYSGRILGEIGEKVGGLDYTAVSMAIKRLEAKAQEDRVIRSALKRLKKECDKGIVTPGTRVFPQNEENNP